MLKKIASLTLLFICLISNVCFGFESMRNSRGYMRSGPIAYAEEDDTYDGFHMQREDDYKKEYGDDHEDAIQDEWEERKG